MGTKRALEQCKHAVALHRGADAIKKLAEASAKHMKLVEVMLKIEKERTMMKLFSMAKNSPDMKRRNENKWNCRITKLLQNYSMRLQSTHQNKHSLFDLLF